MAGGAAGSNTAGTTGTTGPMGSATPTSGNTFGATAPSYGGGYGQPTNPYYQPQAQANKPQGGFGDNQGYGSMGQGFGQSYGGMDAGFRSPFAPPVQSSPFGGMYGPQQYGYGGMGNQFMGGMGGGFGQGYGYPFGGGYGQGFGGMYGPPTTTMPNFEAIRANIKPDQDYASTDAFPAPQDGPTSLYTPEHYAADAPMSASGNPFSQADRINSLMRSLNPFTADAKPLPSFARPNDMRDFGPRGQDPYQQYVNTPGNPQLSQEEWSATQTAQPATQAVQPATQSGGADQGGLAALQQPRRRHMYFGRPAPMGGRFGGGFGVGGGYHIGADGFPTSVNASFVSASNPSTADANPYGGRPVRDFGGFDPSMIGVMKPLEPHTPYAPPWVDPSKAIMG